jgi:MFS family permease
MSIGPVVGLFICHHFGYTAMFISGIATSLISLVCAWFVNIPALPHIRVNFSWKNLFEKNAIPRFSNHG